ncbi:MAG TPA: hypothetical protein VD994_16370, partial [Prosthecobacter sp.]|nr:hypothetical protein [Prosthecobacter sp.]
VIVILDNAFDAAQVAPLLPSGKTYSLFIITSRELIEIDGLLSAVNRVDLPPMDASEVELWMRESDLALGLEGHVEEMMQATGGLPLAISILLSRWHWTGRLKLGGPSAFFNSLKLIKLSAHDRHDTRNQRLTLHRCFTFSTRDLHAREREGLLRLSVFPGRFDAAAVAAVCCPATGSSNEALSQARHLILRLVSISLMEVDQSNQDRYWLHDLVREFCDQELSENPSARADALRAFSEHYAAVACHCGEQFRRGGDHSRAAAKHFILEQQNIGHGYRIAKNLARTLTRRDEVRHAAAAVIVYAGCAIRVADLVQTASDRERWTQSAIDLAQQHFKTLPGLRGRLIVANGLAKRHLNDPKEAMKCMDAAQKVFEKLSQPDWAGISDACGNRGNLHTDLAGLIRDCADKRAEGKMAKKGLINLSEAELIEYRNHYQKAELEHNKARAISEKLPSDRGLGQDLGNLAIVYAEYGRIEKGWGDPEVAKAWFKKALQFYRKRNDQAAHRQVRDDRGRGNGLGNLGNLHCTLGEFAPALKCQEEALKLHKDTGNQRGEAATLGNQASIHFHRGAPGDLEQCIRLNHLSAELFQKLGDEAGGERSLANAKIAETRLAAVREGQAGAKTQTVSEPALHLADRYGKVTDIHLDDILGVRLEGIRRSLELARACENRLRRRR